MQLLRHLRDALMVKASSSFRTGRLLPLHDNHQLVARTELPSSQPRSAGASKAALLHLSRIWDAELAGEGVRVLTLDPGDMDRTARARGTELRSGELEAAGPLPASSSTRSPRRCRRPIGTSSGGSPIKGANHDPRKPAASAPTRGEAAGDRRRRADAPLPAHRVRRPTAARRCGDRERRRHVAGEPSRQSRRDRRCRRGAARGRVSSLISR
jgi:NAD(P)-dependent dehydrogenase (short-subunit alcohol dehydrogenase family)